MVLEHLDITSLLSSDAYSLDYMQTQRHTPEKEMAFHGLLTVRQASRLLRIDQHNVYAGIWGKRLFAKKVRGRWRIPYHEVQRYAARRGSGVKK